MEWAIGITLFVLLGNLFVLALCKASARHAPEE